MHDELDESTTARSERHCIGRWTGTNVTYCTHVSLLDILPHFREAVHPFLRVQPANVVAVIDSAAKVWNSQLQLAAPVFVHTASPCNVLLRAAPMQLTYSASARIDCCGSLFAKGEVVFNRNTCWYTDWRLCATVREARLGIILTVVCVAALLAACAAKGCRKRRNARVATLSAAVATVPLDLHDDV